MLWARMGACGPVNAVKDAFTAGAAVVVAGETHGQLDTAEEKSVWLDSRITVCREEDLLPVAGNGPISGIRFDSPFMSLIACANDVCELVTSDNLADWTSDKEKSRRELLVKEMILLTQVGSTLLGYLRDELTAEGSKTSTRDRKSVV